VTHVAEKRYPLGLPMLLSGAAVFARLKEG